MGIDAHSAKETEANKVWEPLVDFPQHLGVLEMASSSLDSPLVPSSCEDVMCVHTRPVLAHAGSCSFFLYLHATRLLSLWLSLSLVKGAVVVLNLLRA